MIPHRLVANTFKDHTSNQARRQMQTGIGRGHLTHADMRGSLRARVLLSKRCWNRQLTTAQASFSSQSYFTSAVTQQYEQPPSGSGQDELAQSQHQQRLHQQQQQYGVTSKQLNWQELHRAAQIAAWSGLCYQLPEDLQARINQQHAQLTLVAQGRNQYTSWFIADGVVPHKHFCTTVKQRTTAVSGGSNGSGAAASRQDSNGAAANGQDGACQIGNSDDTDVCEVPHAIRERFVFMRGVQWSAHDIDSMKLSQALMRMWPVQFPRTPRKSPDNRPANNADSSRSAAATNVRTAAGTAPASAAGADSALVAHDGVAEIAEGLFEQLRPYLDQADDVGMPICFAGHSLGGSLAMLTLVLYQWQSRRRTGAHPSCYTFGSPPVLAHQQGGGGHHVTTALGLPDNTVKNFVLENDPVPRALLSIDPTFELMKAWGAVKSLLQLRELVAGQGSPLSPTRFLFESVGQVHLIKWTPEGGSEVVPLDAHEIEEELSFLAPKQQSKRAAATYGSSNSSPNSDSGTAGYASTNAAADGGVGGFAAALLQLISPVSYAQAWLDHHHGSYAQELEAATLRSIKQQMVQQQARR